MKSRRLMQNCPSRTKLPKGSVVRHSKFSPPIMQLGHFRTHAQRPPRPRAKSIAARQTGTARSTTILRTQSGLSNRPKRARHPPGTGNASASDLHTSRNQPRPRFCHPSRPCHSPLCRDIGVRELRVGYSFSRVALADRSSELLVHVSIAGGNFIVRLHRTCRSNKRHLHLSGPSPCAWDTACQRSRFRVTLGPIKIQGRFGESIRARTACAKSP